MKTINVPIDQQVAEMWEVQTKPNSQLNINAGSFLIINQGQTNVWINDRYMLAPTEEFGREGFGGKTIVAEYDITYTEPDELPNIVEGKIWKGNRILILKQNQRGVI